MKRREFLVMGGVFGAALAGSWVLVLRPTAPAAPAPPPPADLPPQIGRLLAALTPRAREAYAFALERPDVLQYMPCFCGCGASGHTANLDCFVRSSASGVTLDSHGST